MADRNIKLANHQKFAVGIKTLDRPIGMNIAPGSFVLVSEDDVNYIASISDFIQRGILCVENTATSKEDVAGGIYEYMGIDKNAPSFADDAEIEKQLSGSAKKIGEWLNSITEEFMLDRVYDVAMSMSDKLTAAKLKVLQEKMPTKDFLK